MKLPRLLQPATSCQTVDTFAGYNHNLRIGDGEFYEMQNMTSDCYPVLSPRGKRGVYAEEAAPTGLIEKDALCYVSGSSFVINREAEEMWLNDEPKQLISMGAYVIIMPDKKYINTMDLSDCGSIEAYFPGTEGQTVNARYSLCKSDGTEYGEIEARSAAPEDPVNTQLWIDTSSLPHVLKQYSASSAVWMPVATTYVRISAPNIAQSFSRYDAVRITGLPTQLADMEDQMCVLWEAYHDPGEETGAVSRAEGTNDYIVIVGILDEVITCDSQLRLERTVPEMDFVIESGNRLWGCRYGAAANGQTVNEIYCSKLGDFKNWNCIMNISTDSWVAGCGTDGPFTGAATHLGYPLFFKENCIHKVYGSYPANFQIQTTDCSGVQRGCGKSLATVNTTLFYKAPDGVYAYDGSLPVKVSDALGDGQYSQAAGGALGNKYYISMKDILDAYHLFVYDASRGMWHREDGLQVKEFCACDGELYGIAGSRIITVRGTGVTDTEPVAWMVTTGQIGLRTPETKYISRLTLRMSMGLDAEVRISARYDFSDTWETVCLLKGGSLGSFSIPIRPKRCDHMRLKLEGTGEVKIYSVTKTMEQGSELP